MLASTCPHSLRKVEFAEGDSVFDEQREVLGLDQQGPPVSRRYNARILPVLLPCSESQRRLTWAQYHSPLDTSSGSHKSCGSR